MPNLKENIDILKQAQDLDSQIYQATLALAEEIPEERSKVKRQLEGEKARLKELEDQLKKAQLKQKEKEGELAKKEGDVKKLDGQLGMVKTNKEYSALQQEIASLKADNSILEEEIIRIIDEVEAAEEEVKKEKDRLKQVEKEFQAREAELNKKEQSDKAVIEKLKQDRVAFMDKIDPEIKERYELVLSKKQGVALAKIQGEMCGACQMRLRPQVINEVQMGEILISCENCNRILYIESE